MTDKLCMTTSENDTESQRPSKRPRVSLEEKEKNNRNESNMDGNNGHTGPSKLTKPKWRSQQLAQKQKRARRPPPDHPDMQDSDQQPRFNTVKTFSQPSVISAGDKGIFVTCDKGKEKKSLTELGDLIEEYLEANSLLAQYSSDHNTPSLKPDHVSTAFEERNAESQVLSTSHNTADPDEEDGEVDIESAIKSELNSLRPKPRQIQPSTSDSPPQNLESKSTKTQKPPFNLITLDVPCVSFLRFNPSHQSYVLIEPVKIVHHICNRAMITGQARSRFIKRLTPIVYLSKTLSGGLEKCADEVLPLSFKLSIDENHGSIANQNEEAAEKTETEGLGGSERGASRVSPSTFAIRPTIRNNNKLSRDEIIQFTASRIGELGRGEHKVDLKGYQKGILVEVYCGWVGMCVVSNQNIKEGTQVSTDDGRKEQFEYGFEALKRFNLAEIHAEALKRS